MAIGFSQKTCRPAFRHWIACCAWYLFGRGDVDGVGSAGFQHLFQRLVGLQLELALGPPASIRGHLDSRHGRHARHVLRAADHALTHPAEADNAQTHCIH